MSGKMLGKRFLFFGSANVLAACIPFLLTPFLTKILSPIEYGYIGLFEALLLLLTPLIIFGGDGFFSSNYFKYSENERRQLQLNLLILPTGTSCLVGLVLLLLYYMFGNPTSLDSRLIFLLLPAAYLQSICSLMYAQLQMEGRASLYLLIRVSGPVLGGIATVYFVYFAKWESEARILGIILALAFSAVCSLIIFNKCNVFEQRLSNKSLRKAISFGYGMIVHSWSGVLFFASDRIILGYMLGLREVGAYSIALQIGLVMSIVQTSFSQIWTPFILRKLESNCDNHKLLKFEISAMLILSALGLCIAFLIYPFYFFLVGEEYQYAINIAYWVVGSYVMLGFYKVFSVYLFYSQNTKALAKITLSVAIFNVLLSIVMISNIGMKGAAMATFISSIVFFVLVFYKAKNIKLERIPNYA